nr:MAG: ORF1 [TTV-like mini virus]
MAYYRQTRYRRRKFNRKRRPWISRWRIRNAFQRKQWRNKRRHRRKYKVKNFRRLKKRKAIIVKQFQPYTVKKCKVKGYKCLFQGGPERASNNYFQYVYSFIPELQPGGGGWGLCVFTLDSLFEDYNHLENIWTTSNAGLPLIRYRGCKFTFFQSEETDYIVCYDNCWPMVDTPHKHADSAPFRMLMKHHKIVIPSRQTRRLRKPYKTKFIKPPAQMTTKWYFQKDICKTPLVMLTITSCSLRYPFTAPEAQSNNISFWILNPYLFKNSNFQHYDTSGYFCKYANPDNTEPLYLYACTEPNLTYEKLKNESNKPQIIALTDTKNHTPGNPLNNANENNHTQSWGNPFHEHYTSGDMHIYISKMTPLEMLKLIKNNEEPDNKKKSITNTGNILYSVRYNPQRDDGTSNKAYIVNNELGGLITPPNNSNFIIEGFPLHTMLWGWTDFLRKLGETIHFDQNYFVTIETKQTNDNKLPYLIPVDDTFVHGLNPYSPIHTDPEHQISIDAYNAKNWYPRYEYQKVTINKICMSGPACPRPPWKHYLQAHAKYTFYFTLGGCPKTLEKIYNPCSQPKWPTPDNISGRYEVQDPSTHPATELYSWDWQKDYVTESALQRIRKYTEIDPKIFSISESKNMPVLLQRPQEKDQQKEEEKELQLQLQHIRYQRVLLQLQLQQLK